MTKMFTAVLIMDQVDKGSLALDDRLDRWFEFPWADRVTVENLLNHTSGVPNYTDDFWFLLRYFGQADKTWRPSELSRYIRNQPLELEPGSQHRYSNSNYLLLGMLLERVTGNSYSELFSGIVRSRWGLTNTYYPGSSLHLGIANAYDQSLLHLGSVNLTGFRRSLETGHIFEHV
jgi:D-alanyl-D-alanine carboxypeptidase